jgi:hypothetical protein
MLSQSRQSAKSPGRHPPDEGLDAGSARGRSPAADLLRRRAVCDVDFSGMLNGELREPLREPAYFRRVRVDEEAGTIVWPNGLDPEMVAVRKNRTPHPLTTKPQETNPRAPLSPSTRTSQPALRIDPATPVFMGRAGGRAIHRRVHTPSRRTGGPWRAAGPGLLHLARRSADGPVTRSRLVPGDSLRRAFSGTPASGRRAGAGVSKGTPSSPSPHSVSPSPSPPPRTYMVQRRRPKLLERSA